MRRIVSVVLGLIALLAGMTACGDEDPTGVGGGLIGEDVRTFEVTLDPSSFLMADTTFDNIGNLYSKPFRVVARGFGGVVDANTLFRINRPAVVAYVDTAGNSRTDTIVSYRDARLTLIIDTTGTTPGPVELEVLDIVEDWAPAQATWTERLDTADTPELWTTPGGTTGSVRATATWASGDTLVIPIDSAAAAVWTDTAAARLGALVRSTTAGTRMRLREIRFQWDVLPDGELHPDSTATAGSVGLHASLVDPPPPPPSDGELRIGGTPSWRTLLHFRPIADLVVPCDDSGCTVAVRDAVINLATLVLTPVPGGAYRPERPLRLEGRAVQTAPTVPLVRSPLTLPIGQMADSVDASIFEAPAPDDRVEVPITGYIRQLVDPREGDDTLSWLAIVSTGEGAVASATLGFSTFGSLASATPPRLRLVLSVPVEEVQ